MGQASYNAEELAVALERRDERAFDVLFKEHYEELCRFARAFVRVPDMAEHIVSEVFVRIWERGLRLREGTSLESYLYVAVRNGCVTQMRSRREMVRLESIAEREEEVEELWREERLEEVWTAVERLPEQCRLILKLVVLEDMKYADVAERLGISVNTVKTQMKIAYRELRREFSEKRLLLFFALCGHGEC
ncbi:MAG: RNA polymerase sigma-70 factor [Odoribacter sp.]|nr:RNA polymerase sigma-70 factor [Odoribacter sp.]